MRKRFAKDALEGSVVAVFLKDGHATIGPVERLGAEDLLIVDRNFCTTPFVFGVSRDMPRCGYASIAATCRAIRHGRSGVPAEAWSMPKT